jgi:hypothetical protein
MRATLPALALLALTLTGCGNSGTTDPVESTSVSTPSATSASPTAFSSPTRTETPTPAPQATTPAPAPTQAAGTPGYQRPEPDANGHVGPSEEYYNYDGYVAPGFEYQVGSDCFDVALGRCKSSGEIQAENLGSAPNLGKFTYDEAYAAWQGGMPYYEAFCLNYDPTTPGGASQCTGIENGTVDGVTGEYLGEVGPPVAIPGPGYELRNGCYYKPGTDEVVGCY